MEVVIKNKLLWFYGAAVVLFSLLAFIRLSQNDQRSCRVLKRKVYRSGVDDAVLFQYHVPDTLSRQYGFMHFGIKSCSHLDVLELSGTRQPSTPLLAGLVTVTDGMEVLLLSSDTLANTAFVVRPEGDEDGVFIVRLDRLTPVEDP